MNTSNARQVYNWLNIAEEIPTAPTFLTQEQLTLYFRLMIEELIEVAQSSPNGVNTIKNVIEEIEWAKVDQLEPSHEGIRDGLVDIEVVNHNHTVRGGLTNSYQPHFMTVMTSNLNKYCRDPQEALQGQEEYKKKGIDTWVEDRGNSYYIIKRTSDDKILKGPRFREPKTEL